MARSHRLIPAAAWLALAAASTQTAVSTASLGVSSELRAEGRVAASLDIPDNQVFLSFRNASGGYSIAFPEGWLERGGGQTVSFQDKSNLLRVSISSGPPFSTASVRADLAALKRSGPSLAASRPAAVALPSGSAVEVSYSTVSAPDPVTGKRVALVVDRYYLSKAGRRAIVDLAAAKGADNVDAYRLIIRSFRWR